MTLKTRKNLAKRRQKARKMTKYRLNAADSGQVTLNFVPKTKIVGGRPTVTYSNYMRLAPDTVYETDDEAMLVFLRNHLTKVRYTASAEKALKENGVPYEIEICPSCGGRIKKLKYHTVEVLDE